MSSSRTPGEGSAPSSRDLALRMAVRDVGAILLSWGALLCVELAGVAATSREPLGEGAHAVPVGLAMLVPAAIAAAALGHLARLTGDRERRGGRAALAAIVALGLCAVAVGVSHGRHFTSVAVRGAFVVAVAALASGATYLAAPSCVRLLEGYRGRIVALALGAGGSALFWEADRAILPHLYPAFHDLLFALTLASAALTVLAWRSPTRAGVPEGELAVGLVGVAFAVLACVASRGAARRLGREDAARLALVDRAPLLGRAVAAAAWLAPPAVVIAPASAVPMVAEIPRSFDWSRADIVLISVDALRADHVGAYGYARPTTPNLDALARESAVFEHAYCPTPSTSYSVTSMMTGKAMRPLLALGLAGDSETWASYLRERGYQTAAFYPPAIFYIDADRFTELEKTGLGFEHRTAAFASAEERVKEAGEYLAGAGPAPLFLWVHFYEPHEPYVTHPGHELGGDRPVDAYDSEIAYTDAAIGALLRAVRSARAGHPIAILATADHGEEFGEHGGSYHGTTVYEEQVRVPLLVSGPGVAKGRVKTVVQTIDLLPTVLSAVGVARPVRVRGRDLGELLHGDASPQGPGVAYAETFDRTLVARGDDRLICARKIGACALFDLATDPEERVDRAPKEPALARDLRALTVGIERDLGKDEGSEAALPEALRRGMQGEADAAVDVAALLKDPSVIVRRKAAEVSFRLAARDVAPRLRSALASDSDDEVRRWASLALVAMGEAPSPTAGALVHDADPTWRRTASLAFAQRGDPRGKAELEAWWRAEGPSRARGVHIHTPDAAELLRGLSKIRDVDVVPALLESLGYYPLRPRIAEALGDIGDARAKAPLLASFGSERYEPARSSEARALFALGAASEALAPLTRYAGSSEPMTEAVALARDAKLLDASAHGATFEPARIDVDVRATLPDGASSARLWVLAAAEGAELSGKIEGLGLGSVTTSGVTHRVDLRDVAGKGAVRLQLREPKGVRAVWIVPSPSER